MSELSPRHTSAQNFFNADNTAVATERHARLVLICNEIGTFAGPESHFAKRLIDVSRIPALRWVSEGPATVAVHRLLPYEDRLLERVHPFGLVVSAVGIAGSVKQYFRIGLNGANEVMPGESYTKIVTTRGFRASDDKIVDPNSPERADIGTQQQLQYWQSQCAVYSGDDERRGPLMMPDDIELLEELIHCYRAAQH